MMLSLILTQFFTDCTPPPERLKESIPLGHCLKDRPLDLEMAESDEEESTSAIMFIRSIIGKEYVIVIKNRF
jgi:hypothetical protein